MHRSATSEAQYLMSPLTDWSLAAAVLCVTAYGVLTAPATYPYSLHILLLFGGAAAGVLIRLPKAFIYAVLMLALLLRVGVFTHGIANGEQDPHSTRDEAVEVATYSLLRGANAWNEDPTPESPSTTGPTSILLAIPFVLAFGEINWLSFLFWAAFGATLLGADVVHRNQTWPILVGLLILGGWGIDHTLFFSLEELYYPFLYLALAWVAACRGWSTCIGVLLAAAVLSRSSYVFPVMGFGLWYLMRGQARSGDVIRILLGVLVGAVCIVLPFAWIGGEDFLARNPWRLALGFSAGGWPPTNSAFRALNGVASALGPGGTQLLKLGLVMLVMYATARGLSSHNLQHPFWHVTVGSLAAHTLVWVPVQLSNDYVLMVVLPAMLAVAMTPVSAGAAQVQSWRYTPAHLHALARRREPPGKA